VISYGFFRSFIFFKKKALKTLTSRSVFDMSFFGWFDKKVDALGSLDESSGIRWHDAKRLSQLKAFIGNLEKIKFDFSNNKEALNRINELEGIYKNLLNYYNLHDEKSLFELRKVLPKLDISEINKKEESLKEFISQLDTVYSKFAGFKTPDVPFEFYTEKSDENLEMPDAVSFALSQGSVLQSAREAVIKRMSIGKDDFNYYYNTRTVAIYFKQGDGLFVAFDDDPFDNILVSYRKDENGKDKNLFVEEGRKAGNEWLIEPEDSQAWNIIQNAIKRAKNNNRIIQVTNENTKTDSIKVAECIIGDKTEKYTKFIKDHRSKDLKAYVLDNSDCSKVNSSSNKALVRLVGLRGVSYFVNLGADVSCSSIWRARGVKKIFSSGNGGWVCYVGLMIFKKLRLNEAGVSSYFKPIESQLKDDKAISLFYAGLGACKNHINNPQELAEMIKVLIPIVNKAVVELKETKDLFTGLKLHKKLIYGISDINSFILLYFRILKRTPKQAKNIYEDIELLIDHGLVKNSSQLADVDAYLSEFQFLTLERYSHYLSLDPSMRKDYLRNHKRKYLAIALGEQHEISPDDYELIWYAVNSKNLTKDIIQKTLQHYGKEASKLSKPEFETFDLDYISEVLGYRTDPLKKEYGEMLASISLILLEENYPYAEVLKKFDLTTENTGKNILALTKMQNNPVSDDILQLVYGKAYPQLKQNNYLRDVAWIFSIKFTVDSDFGEDQKNNLRQATKLNSLNYNKPTKIEFETILTVYNTYIELYNDTIKHHFDDKEFLDEIHRPRSKIESIGKELKKIKSITSKNKINIRCIPSRAPLDLFYGYYGENCTSEYPQELFDEPFTPVRIIQMSSNEPTIEGCIHLYSTNYKGKKILAVLGIEPRNDFTVRSDPKMLFEAFNNMIEKQAKKHNYDYVCYPESSTMHSNRPPIATKIAEFIRNRKTIPLDIKFPKDHSQYSTKKLYITWEK
jgi:hypothetical protein